MGRAGARFPDARGEASPDPPAPGQELVKPRPFAGNLEPRILVKVERGKLFPQVGGLRILRAKRQSCARNRS